MIDKHENKEICKKCGGYCCKKSGCDYFVSDFENMGIKYLDEVLKTGRASIVASFDFKKLSTGQLTYTPILSLRARNRNRDIIDLLSFKTTCSSLEENGCYFDLDKRPGGGAALIPQENSICYSNVDRLEELQKWIPYQKTLEKLVKRYTGVSVETKLKQDIENLFYNFYTDNYSDSMPNEIEDVAKLIILLKNCFEEEFISAMKKIKNNQKSLVLLRKKSNK